MKAGLSSLSNFVAKSLVDAEFTKVFTEIPSAADAPEPIVVGPGGYVRDVRITGDERGAVTVPVRVVRETGGEAESVACACETAIRRAGWDRFADCGQYRVCGLDTTAPHFEKRDSSGRCVWTLEVILTVVRTVL